MKSVYVLNGPNLNLLGTREPQVYGSQTLADVQVLCEQACARLGLQLEFRQSNHEGDLVEAVQQLRGRADGAIVNAAALTHSSLSLRDALLAVKVPFVEVHLSNIFAREPERRHSVLADLAVGVIAGFGPQGYVLALQALAGRLRAG